MSRCHQCRLCEQRRGESGASIIRPLVTLMYLFSFACDARHLHVTLVGCVAHHGHMVMVTTRQHERLMGQTLQLTREPSMHQRKLCIQ